MADGTSAARAMRAFAELGQIRLAETSLDQVLGRVATLAQQTIPGAAEVSVTLVTGGVPGTASCTGDGALACDEKQYDAGYGPCLDAARMHDILVITDMKTEPRWPDYAAIAVEHGVHSSISVGVQAQQNVDAALNVYGVEPDVFGDDSVGLAREFAGYAAVALGNASLYSSTAALAAQMAAAMRSRAVIEQAKGVLIAQGGLTPDAAFDAISRASQASNRKLRDIAAAIVRGAQNSAEGDAS
jgi:GAF domain-containing protein